MSSSSTATIGGSDGGSCGVCSTIGSGGRLSGGSACEECPGAYVNQIDKSVLAQLDVQVVLDNSSTHKTPSIQRWLVPPPALHTPFHADLQLLAESRRALVRRADQQVDQAQRRTTAVRDLVASIRAWITNWNDDPKPFVWHKTADEILDSLAAYCQRINDSAMRLVFGRADSSESVCPSRRVAALRSRRARRCDHSARLS